MSMVSAASVPPADLMGPAKDTDRYCEESMLLLIVTPDIPCSGATVTPSVTTARETLTALSSRVFKSPVPYSPAAISSAIFSAAFSLVVCDKRARSLSAISILCILAALVNILQNTLLILPVECRHADILQMGFSFLQYHGFIAP